MKNKVFGYITRMSGGMRQVLVYSNRHQPESGIQIPGGTVEPGEKEEETLYREIEEESGLVHLRFVGKLGKTIHKKPLRKETWHFFQVESLESPAHHWVHRVSSFGKDDGNVYEFFWMPIAEAQKKLAKGQTDFLNQLSDPIPGKSETAPATFSGATLPSLNAE
ncbi:MAG: NUDIX domain-containing protein [Bacteroidia bacterium]|nr:NUDIX domain-containing protein [Bacteroidia bacterium]